MATSRRYGDLVQQYLELRDQHPGVILLFRVGSFYEILFDDAELVAGVLGLKLGERPSGGTAGPVNRGDAAPARAEFEMVAVEGWPWQRPPFEL